METYVSILSKVIITVLGIAYPILFQVVSRLDDKYASVVVVKLFNKEKTRSLFVFALISAVLALFCWVMDFKAKQIHPSLDYIVQNSAEFFLKITSAGLLIMFFLFVRKILIYYTPTDFVKYLIGKHDEVRNDEKRLLYFRALSDILLQSIRNNRVEIAKTITDFMHDSFRKARSKDDNEYIIYPQDYYDLVLLVSEELANNTKNKFKFLEHRTTGGIWFLGDFSDSKLSDHTFRCIWFSLLYAVENNNDDMFMTYWSNAHQYLTFNLTSITPEYGDNFDVLNEEEIKRREVDRKKFKNFHYALGGLLLYRGKYRCINRILNYTTSLPPSYPLLPNGMTDIFKAFYDYLDTQYERRLWISELFKFPGLEGEFANQQIKLYICRYISLLFIRQYFVIPYYIYNRPMDFPLLPDSQAEKKEWADSILFFKRQVEVLLRNSKLLKRVGFEQFSREWCDRNEKLYPIEYLDQVKTMLEEAFEHAEINNRISLDKKQQYFDSSAIIINQLFTDLSRACNPGLVLTKGNTWLLTGARTIFDKYAFSNDTNVHHIDYDSFLASTISDGIRTTFSESFYQNRTKTYLINEGQLFKAIDKLSIVDKEKFVLVAFGINLDYFVNVLKIDNLTNDSYGGIEIISYNRTRSRLLGDCMFLLEKTNLPKIISLQVKEEEIQRFDLEMIDEEEVIYGSVIDLNLNVALRNEVDNGNVDRNYSKSVITCLGFNKELRWKKSIKLIYLGIYREFISSGLPNSTSDIKPYKRKYSAANTH